MRENRPGEQGGQDGRDGLGRHGQPDRQGTSDLGLQSERTRLAWSRTALSFVALGGLLLHTGLVQQRAYGFTPGALVIAFGIAIYVLGRVRYRSILDAARRSSSVSAAYPLRAVGIFGAVTALLTLLSLILPAAAP